MRQPGGEATLSSAGPSKLSDVNAADADLVQACLRGDTQAFEELYRRHSVRLYNLAYRMCGNTADAEDLLQEIFLLVHRKLPTFKGGSALGTWLYRLAMNHCLDHLRSRGHRMDERSEPLDVAHPARSQPADWPLTRVDLERAVAQLPEGCRVAFLLHDVEGFEHQEIARILDVKEGTSKSQVHKARMRIRAYLRKAVQPSGVTS
jgi:RNA polymerase sigma-70 factor (ECF subfamily)